MKSVIFLMVSLGLISVGHTGESCGVAKKGSDCEVVKVLTRCDVDKQALRHRIAVLEKRIKELEGKPIPVITQYRFRDRVTEKQVIKHSILSLYMARDVSSVNVSQQGGGTATVQTSFLPGIKYQYQFNFGLVPEVGINTNGNPIFGLGFEF